MKKRVIATTLVAAMLIGTAFSASGCSSEGSSDGKTHITMLQYKPEAVKAFEKMEAEFNASHDDIVLKIESPNDAMTVLKTRFIKEDAPDIIGIGGDDNFSNFLDAEMLMDISDFEGLSLIKQAYLDIDKNLEFVPMDGVYAVPYVANAAGVLYNREMFKKNKWEIPTTWDEFMDLCDEIKASGQQPLYFGYKDVWTCLAPWNALACDLAPADVCRQVNKGETTFSEEYPEVAEKMLELLDHAQDDPFAYNYNDACTAFANGESAMYCIQSVNPDMDIDSFVMPGCDNADDNVLNSGVDLQFCVTSECKNKEAAYEVLQFMLEDSTIQTYLDDQNAVPCKDKEFELSPALDSMVDYINEGKMVDYQDHYYPAEMSVDAQIQTFLLDGDVEKFLNKFDTDWVRYNRDIIRKVQEYEEKGGNE